MDNQLSQKNILAINASPRSKHTSQKIAQISDILIQSGFTVEVINLADYSISDCVGCQVCLSRTSACWQKDDSKQILDRIEQADGLIIASPVYMMNVPGKLKSLFDKTASWVHRPPLTGKPALLLATTAGSGLRDVLAYLQKVIIQWGMHPAGKIGRTVSNQKPIAPSEIQQFINLLKQDAPRKHRPSFEQLSFFQVQKALALKILQNDREYWTERGWDRALYYYPCKITPIKKFYSWMLYTILDRRIQPLPVPIRE